MTVLFPASAAAQQISAVVDSTSPVPAQAGKQAFAQVLPRLAVIISSSIARRDTDRPVFHGCYDWHSAVHGHWALLRIARVSDPNRAEAVAADKSMSAEGIAQEAIFLRENPYFEMPYGRSWFLRLAVEHEKWMRQTSGADPQRLRPMAEQVAQSLMAYYEEFAPTPFTHEYNNASWAMVQLYDYFRHTDNREGLARLTAHVRNRFLGAQGMDIGADGTSPEFFSPFANWVYLIAKTQDSKTLERFLMAHPISDANLRPVSRLVPNMHRPRREYQPDAHHFGANWSRAWALRRLGQASLTPVERTRYQRAFEEHVRAGLEHHRDYSGDYGMYDHWVPQFAVYALTEGEAD